MQAEAESLSFISHKFIDTASSRGRLVLDDSAGDGSAAGPISPEGSFPYMGAISPNGSKVATLADASTIYVYDLVRWVRRRRE
jgi:hypothetical protein